MNKENRTITLFRTIMSIIFFILSFYAAQSFADLDDNSSYGLLWLINLVVYSILFLSSFSILYIGLSNLLTYILEKLELITKEDKKETSFFHSLLKSILKSILFVILSIQFIFLLFYFL